MMLVWIGLYSLGGVLGLALFLTALGVMGSPGRKVSDVLCRAPFLDLIVALFTFVPWIPGVWFGGWLGLPAAMAGQVVGLGAWVVMHEWIYRRHIGGPRIVRVINNAVGRWRNHAALWVTVVVLPVFWMIRLAQFTMYPLLVLLLGFPRYKQGEWVNCSRHKFDGLVGHDLIWCLYCDWMTGVYSLGAEMLRNVESFWCPIRFYDGKKCENCRVDFPDIDGGWVPATGNMADVEAKMKEMYGDGPGGRREWFGHPARKGGAAGGAEGTPASSPPLTPPIPSEPTQVTIEGEKPQ